MKKIAIFFLCIIIIISGITYLYLNYKAQQNEAKIKNREFNSYLNQEIYGSELATIINRAIDNNITNEVQKDNRGKYINNDNNSINIDVKMLDYKKTYNMEIFYNGKISKFVEAYGNTL